MEFLLFKPTEERPPHLPLTKETVRIEIFKPKLTKLYSPYECDRAFRISLFRVYTYILTGGRVKIYFALGESGKILHSAYTIPPNWKYAFLGKHEINIGPCNTIEEARGKGLYPQMIDHIVTEHPDASCCLMIREENTASIRGAQKAGFVLTDIRVKQTRLLHRFVCEKTR